ncbi:hypothetical protein [Amycolatopsis regifaucium]|uniref:DUF4878 domain-containing protein n=1 Tax=Amycolatopsis regifaucium TaxID=546365 RepID=A0A154MFR6_9PSEU|nr:hypothetical protein [Amycolatopsis regifaucium]KZB82399.1 hypothetical protein AVL48_10830 [Amycolatopsis regifaucium]OKA10204.1 hypothetical protein ATP06_0204720 [Amycolatopsis regifaucium]SFG91733.1 hypothetical protein SAMN04489731_101957 [Amycolatopsis regifaucium]
MTYPPQPHYDHGGQQHPGQQYQQGGHDQSGAYPQQQYPGYGQSQQYGQGFGGPPAPLKNGKTSLLVVIAVAVVMLVTLGITGFVAPGFFLGDDKADKAAGPEETARAVVAGINAHDKTALRALKCGNADKDIDQAIDQVDEAANATLGELAKVSETEYSVVVEVSVKGRSRTAAGTLADEAGRWCWKELGRPRAKTSVPG